METLDLILWALSLVLGFSLINNLKRAESLVVVAIVIIFGSFMASLSTGFISSIITTIAINFGEGIQKVAITLIAMCMIISTITFVVAICGAWSVTAITVCMFGIGQWFGYIGLSTGEWQPLWFNLWALFIGLVLGYVHKRQSTTSSHIV